MIRIMGIGSPFGDDQVGWRVAELLQKAPPLKHYLNQFLDIQISDRPGLGLTMIMDGIKTLYLVDALKAENNQIGQICRIENKNLMTKKEIFFSTHGFGVAAALELAQVLGKLPVETIVYGIKIDVIDYQVSLSPHIAKACDELAHQMTQELLTKLRDS
jgi:hydrogenase maturation protease